MQIEFIGAARTVTGSSYIIKDGDFTIMVDCGMFQGKREIKDRNHLNRIYAPGKIDALLLTHAHIDHSGLIPKLVKEGFYGNIYTTKATADLCSVMLPDSGHIQEMDAKWVNKKNKRLGRPEVEPIYNVKDAEKALENFVPLSYGETVQIHPRIKVRFRDAGHILGSAIIEMWIDEKGKQKKIVFSGDLGPTGQAIIRDPEIVDEADVLLIESTYGDRLHKSKQDTYVEFKDILQHALNKKGNIIIPAFAIERTQELIYALARMVNSDKLPAIPVYIDSPLAISATEIFRRNRDCFDKETQKILLEGDSPLDFNSLHFSRTSKESKQLARETGSIIISASGMCTAGRIKYHLRDNLYKQEASVIFVGYQAEGTLGRRIIEGAKQVRLYGKDVKVNARIHTLGGFSAHADRDGLIAWLSNINNPDLKVFVVHGEEKASLSFAETVRERVGVTAYVPMWGETVDVDTLKSVMTTYGLDDKPVEKYTEIDHEIDSLTQTINKLKDQYHEMVSQKSYMNTEQLQDDLEDIRSLIAMVIDEL